MSTKNENFLKKTALVGVSLHQDIIKVKKSGQKSGQIFSYEASLWGICIGGMHMSTIFRYRRIRGSFSLLASEQVGKSDPIHRKLVIATIINKQL